MEMAHALLRSGVVTNDDVRRLEAEHEAEEEAKAALAHREFLALQAENKLDNTLRRNKNGYEIKGWMRNTGKVIPMEVLERWNELDERDQSIEWSKWLAAYRLHQKEVAN